MSIPIPLSYKTPSKYDVLIGYDKITLPDLSPLDFWTYSPQGQTAHSPLVIISGGTKSSGSIESSTSVSPFSNLATAYAMNGYKTVVLDHEDAAGFTGPLTNRSKEVNGAIDKLTVSGQEVILVGHSLGAANALIMGMSNKSAYNPAISTIIAISPPTPDQSSYNLSPDDWNYLDIPSLFITGTRDTMIYDSSVQTVPYQDRLDGALLAVKDGNTDIVTVVINRANHFSFGDSASASNQNIVISMSLAMSDRYNNCLSPATQIAADNFIRNANQAYSATRSIFTYYQ